MNAKRKKKWSELSGAGKSAVVVALLTHVVLVGFAHRDLSSRPAEAIRGPKWLWRLATSANTGFIAAYFLVGRRHEGAGGSVATTR